MIFFEYLLTFDQEVRLFWGKKPTGAVALFFANRYATIIYTIYYMLVNVVPSTTATAKVSVSLARAFKMCTYGAELHRRMDAPEAIAK